MKSQPVRRLTKEVLKRINLGEKYWAAKRSDLPLDDPDRKLIIAYIDALSSHIKAGKGLYLWGDNSKGKTHRLAIIMKAAAASGYSAYMISAEEFKDAGIRNAMFDEDQTIIERCRTVDILGLDDLGKEYRGSGSGFSETNIENLLRYRSRRSKATIITANLSPSQFEDIFLKSAAELLKELGVPIQVRSSINWRELQMETFRNELKGQTS